VTHFYRFDDVQIDLRSFRLSKAGKVLQVEPKALKLLVCLVENRGRLVEKRELLDAVWDDAFVTENVLTRAVAQLRKALADNAKDARYIETVPTLGYRFIAEVEVAEDGETASRSVAASPAASGASSAFSSPTPPPKRTGTRRLLPVAPLSAAVLACGLLIALAIFRSKPRLEYYRPGNVIQITTSHGLSIYPAFSPDDSAMAYSTDTGKGFEIFVRQLAPEGQEVQITSDGGQNMQPAWAPDGKLIAYYSYSRGGVWLVPALGGPARQLTDFGSHPAWSPDNQWIVFQSNPISNLSGNTDAPSFSRGSTIWVIRSDGTGARQITPPGVPSGGHGDPSWSPDGKHIVFATDDDSRAGLWAIAPDGTGSVRLSPPDPLSPEPYDPVYSPDGKSVVFGASRGLWQIHVFPQTSAPLGPPVQITNAGENRLRNLALSRDGKRLLYATYAQTSTLQSLALSPAGRPIGEPALLRPDVGCDNAVPAFSPDGTRIAYFSCRAGSQGQIWLMSSGGANAQLLNSSPASFSMPAWYPDGNHILYLSSQDEHSRFFSINSETRQQQLVADLPQHVDRFALSPDGRQLAFDSAIAGVWNVWVLDLGTGNTRQLTFGKEVLAFPLWSPDGNFISADLQHGADTNITIVPAGGGPVTQLTFDHGNDWSGGWSPDSGKIIFAKRPPGGFWNVWTVSRPSKAEQQLTHYTKLNTFVYSPVMSPHGDRIVYEYGETTGNIWMLDLDQPQ
jgi:Tol biopolymer transport system component/DNA-binding winged helix-turn-helix (wHTH) protein